MLTDSEIAALELPKFEEEIEFGQNLVLKVRWPNSRKWSFRYWSGKGWAGVHIGRHPDVNLAAALACTQLLTDWIQAGFNPREQKRKYRQQGGHWPPVGSNQP